MVYVSSDWHGFPLSRIRELLEKAHFSADDYLFVIGDVIDRGEHGVELLKWLMLQPNVELLLGNHEAMLLECEFLFGEITEASADALSPDDLIALDHWRDNGAEPTITALTHESPAMRADILEYLWACPHYDTVHVGEQDYLLVHAGLGHYTEGKRFCDYDEAHLLWTRPHLNTRYSERFITVIGHTPTVFFGPEYRGRICRTDTWWCIDTGAAGGIPPMLLCLDDGQEYYLDET